MFMFKKDEKSNSINKDKESISRYFQVNNPGELWEQNKELMDYQQEHYNSIIQSNRNRLIKFN